MPEDIDLGNGLMLRQLPEGSYTYPKSIPTEETALDTDPFARAAARIRQGVKGRQRLPIDEPTPYKAPNYVMEPDLLEAQQGAHLPTGIAYNDAGIPFNLKTGTELPTVPRPNVLPIAKTPEGLTFAMPKAMDIFGNIMGGVAGAPVKGAEVLLGSGPVRKVAGEVASGPFFSALERAVNTAKVGKADAQQWLGYLKNQPGVKSEELSTVLGGMEGQLTKQRVQELVKQNKVSLGEVIKGKTADVRKKELEQIGEENRTLQQQNEYEDILEGNWTGEPSVNNTATKFSEYQLPGGEPGSYKEMLLTLPESKGPFGNAAYDAANNYKFELHKKYGDGIRNKASKEELAKLDDLETRGELKNPDFRSSHWDEPNIIAHIRHNDRMLGGATPEQLSAIEQKLATALGTDIKS